MPLFISIYVFLAVLGFVMMSMETETTPVYLLHDRVRPSRAGRLYLAISMGLMLFVCGCRDLSVGTDTDNYVDSFENSAILNRTVNGESKFELGYVLLVKAILLFTDSSQVFIFMLTLVMFIGTYIFLYNNCSGSIYCSVLVYLPFLYYINFSAIRQALALAIAANCLQYINRKQWLIAAAVIGLGGLFHSTVLVLMILIPISMVKITEKNIKYVVALCICGVILFERLLQIVFRIFPIYARSWGSDMRDGNGKSSVGVFALMGGFVCVYSYYIASSKKNDSSILLLDKIYKMVFRCKTTPSESQRRGYIIALIGTIFCLTINLLGRQYGIFSRLARYFIPFFIVLVCENYRYYVKQKKLVYCAIAVLMGVYFYIIMRANVYKIIPYRFFFQ